MEFMPPRPVGEAFRDLRQASQAAGPVARRVVAHELFHLIREMEGKAPHGVVTAEELSAEKELLTALYRVVESLSTVGPKKGLTGSEMSTSFLMGVMGIQYPRGSVSPEVSLAQATITFSASYSPLWALTL